MFDPYIGWYLATKYDFNLRKIAPRGIDNNMNILAARVSPRTSRSWQPEVGSCPYAYATLRCMRRRGRGNNLNVTGANFSARLAESPEWAMTYVYCAKNIAYVN